MAASILAGETLTKGSVILCRMPHVTGSVPDGSPGGAPLRIHGRDPARCCRTAQRNGDGEFRQERPCPVAPGIAGVGRPPAVLPGRWVGPLLATAEA